MLTKYEVLELLGSGIETSYKNSLGVVLVATPASQANFQMALNSISKKKRAFRRQSNLNPTGNDDFVESNNVERPTLPITPKRQSKRIASKKH